MLNILYPSLIFAGIIILAVVFYLRQSTTSFLRVLTEIITMNEMNEYDPVKFVNNLPPLMEKLGVEAYSYYFFYLDTEQSKPDEHSKGSIKKFVCDNDFTVYVEISPGKLRREKSYLGNLLVETIFLIIKIDVNLNIRANTKALADVSKINTFLTHDIKNLAQFIGIMEHNLSENLDNEKKDRLIEYLRTTAPSLKMRSDRVLLALEKSASAFMPELDDVNPYDIAKGIADILNVHIVCEDKDVTIRTDRKRLIIIFENIIKNFYDKSVYENGIKLTMYVLRSGQDVTVIFADNGSPISNVEKIFEPFYSEKSNGLGIGLYHCRNIVNGMNGKLVAENTNEGPRFILNLTSL